MSSGRPVETAENRLEHFNADRARLLADVERRVVTRLTDAAKAAQPVGTASATATSQAASLEYVINDVCYQEIRRLEAGQGNDAALARWRDLSRRLLGMNEAERIAELHSLTSYYSHDVVGNFDPRVYKFATGIAPSILGFVFSPIASLREGVQSIAALDARISADGELDVVRACAKRGTIVVVPTHSSNMDSPVIGLGLLRAGLPPVTYGAGKNLFTNPFISYFMRNLGAYRVDRRLRFDLYKDVLKEYSTVLLENGYHSLFFPGGTRCRSNLVEKNLKLGLLGTTVTAYKNSVRDGAPNKRIYIVPATINYRLVLEAETLIADYLAEVGKNRYIITDDEFSRFGRIAEFMRRILVHEGSVVVRFGRPLDVFGNEITDTGESLDRAGRVVDPASFVRGADGQVRDDDQRDAEYTRALGRKLAAAYPRLTVFHATHLLARTLFDAVADACGTRDVYRLLRAPAGRLEIPMAEALARMAALRKLLREQPQQGDEHPMLAQASDRDIIDDAVRGLSTYHTKAAVTQRGDFLVVGDLNLLYYYNNRMAHVGGE